ncbi:MAG: ABC transporter ATP-binding protein [Candidatus Omnitrophica bacterium]|nr:ABC transporter ATP-binding protein [Candidatus Omnitrophota bacterium]
MLKLTNVHCGYNGDFSLRNISLEVRDSEIVGVIGPNGSGKTTLLRAITKVAALRQGSVIFDGIDLSAVTAHQLAHSIAVVAQDMYIPAGMTVEEFVALGRIPHQRRLQLCESRRDKEAVREAMELAGIASCAGRDVQALSGGERQLAVIAKALAQEPQLLLLDEPVVYLDIAHQVEILNCMRRLRRKKNIAVLITLHELNLAGEYCDRLVLLNRGAVQAIGRPQDILTAEMIEQVYHTRVIIQNHPLSGKPYMIVAPEPTII